MDKKGKSYMLSDEAVRQLAGVVFKRANMIDTVPGYEGNHISADLKCMATFMQEVTIPEMVDLMVAALGALATLHVKNLRLVKSTFHQAAMHIAHNTHLALAEDDDEEKEEDEKPVIIPVSTSN